MDSLLSCFEKDFRDTLTIHTELNLYPTSGEIKVIAKAHLDFANKTKFISFFVPRCSQAWDVCFTLLSKIDEASKSLFAAMEERIEVNTADFTFSGIVYIYSENFLNPGELSSLEESYGDQSISFKFRGTSYLAEKVKEQFLRITNKTIKNLKTKDQTEITFSDDNYKQLFNSVVCKTIMPEDFVRNLWKLSTGQKRNGRKYKGTKKEPIRIYRARRFDEGTSLQKDISQYSYKRTNIALGRANVEDRPVFYASAGGPTTFVESRCAVGEIVVVSEFRLFGDLFVQQVGFVNDELKPSDYEVLLHEIFTWPGEDLYRYSSLVAEHLMHGDSIHGLIYPSIASNNQSENLAIKPGIIDNSAVFINATAYKIKSVSDAFNFEVDEIDFGVISENEVLWKGRKRQFPHSLQGLKLVSNGWSWDTFCLDGTLVDPE